MRVCNAYTRTDIQFGTMSAITIVEYTIYIIVVKVENHDIWQYVSASVSLCDFFT
jgi:hypothetical protein